MMMKTHGHVLLLLSYCCWLHCAASRGAHFNRLSLNGAVDATGVAASGGGGATASGVSSPSAAAATSSLADQHDWQPLAAHSNWIIVQSAPARVAGQSNTPSSAANRFIQAYTTGQRDVAPRPNPYNGGYSAAERPQSQWPYNTAFSRRRDGSGNRTFASTPLNAGSALRRHSLDRDDAVAPPQQPYATVVLPQHSSLQTSEALLLTPQHFRQRAPPAGGAPSERGATTPADAKLPVLVGGRDKTAGNAIDNDVAENVDAYGVGVVTDLDDIDDERLDELLLPLQGAVERVRDFCDIVQGIISQATGAPEDDEDSQGGAEEKSSAEIATKKKQESNRWADLTTNDAQARSSGTTHLFAANSASTAHLSSSFVGSGRKSKKIKKKLKKLLLPLLIAYKLKFMALIPVLIGGLTLLVGTTGMAGFFFALFTAVMSLKGSGSKSIVLKKI